MTKHVFELLKSGKYNPFKYDYVYYLETNKPIFIPSYIQKDEDNWSGPNNPRTHKRQVVPQRYSSTILEICGSEYCGNMAEKIKLNFEDDSIIFTITPSETIQVKKDDGTNDYITKYLPSFKIKIDYRNIKRFVK